MNCLNLSGEKGATSFFTHSAKKLLDVDIAVVVVVNIAVVVVVNVVIVVVVVIVEADVDFNDVELETKWAATWRKVTPTQMKPKK